MECESRRFSLSRRAWTLLPTCVVVSCAALAGLDEDRPLALEDGGSADSGGAGGVAGSGGQAGSDGDGAAGSAAATSGDSGSDAFEDGAGGLAGSGCAVFGGEGNQIGHTVSIDSQHAVILAGNYMGTPISARASFRRVTSRRGDTCS